MPTYEYRCSLCQHEWETEQSIKELPLDLCVRCGEKAAQRLLSRGSFVLKGDGWSAAGYGSTGGK